MNNINCGYYSRAAFIYLCALHVRLLFEGGYHSGCGYYSNKYGIYVGLPGKMYIDSAMHKTANTLSCSTHNFTSMHTIGPVLIAKI